MRRASILLASIPLLASAAERSLMIKVEAKPGSCTSCGAKMAEAALTVPGVARVAGTTSSKDAIFVLYTMGKTDADEIVRAIRLSGYNASVTWGPVARGLNGAPEEILPYELPRKAPTLKEIWAARRSKKNVLISAPSAAPPSAQRPEAAREPRPAGGPPSPEELKRLADQRAADERAAAEVAKSANRRKPRQSEPPPRALELGEKMYAAPAHETLPRTEKSNVIEVQ